MKFTISITSLNTFSKEVHSTTFSHEGFSMYDAMIHNDGIIAGAPSVQIPQQWSQDRLFLVRNSSTTLKISSPLVVVTGSLQNRNCSITLSPSINLPHNIINVWVLVSWLKWVQIHRKLKRTRAEWIKISPFWFRKHLNFSQFSVNVKSKLKIRKQIEAKKKRKSPSPTNPLPFRIPQSRIEFRLLHLHLQDSQFDFRISLQSVTCSHHIRWFDW